MERQKEEGNVVFLDDYKKKKKKASMEKKGLKIVLAEDIEKINV